MAMSPASFSLAGDCAFGNAERMRGEYVEACPEDLEPCMSLRADRAFRGFRRFGRRRRTDFQPTHPNRERCRWTFPAVKIDGAAYSGKTTKWAAKRVTVS
jgi:hypothetical protein